MRLASWLGQPVIIAKRCAGFGWPRRSKPASVADGCPILARSGRKWRRLVLRHLARSALPKPKTSHDKCEYQDCSELGDQGGVEQKAGKIQIHEDQS